MHRSSTLLVLLAGVACTGTTSEKDGTTPTDTPTPTTTHHTTDTWWVDRGWTDSTDADTDSDTDADSDADTDTGHTGAPHSGLRWHTGDTGKTH